MPTNRYQLNATGQSDLDLAIPEIWAARVFHQAFGAMYWTRFTGPEGSSMPIIQKEEVLNTAGDKINIQRVANLTGSGVSGESVLEGSEETLTLAEIELTPEWYRNGVAVTKPGEKKITFNFRTQASFVLSRWMTKKMDTSAWTELRRTTAAGFGSSTITTVYGGDATSLDSIDSADTFGVTELLKAVAELEANDVDRVVPPTAPDAPGYYLCFIHPYQAYSLRSDSEWQEAQRDANIRGKDNPLFSGALGEYGGAIVYSTTQCTRVQNSASPAVYTARAVMVGREAMARGVKENLEWEEQVTDYKWRKGIAISAAWDDEVLNEEAIIHILTAAVAPGT